MHASRTHNDEMDVCPLQRDGMPVVVFRVVTKEMKARIKKPNKMTCTRRASIDLL